MTALPTRLARGTGRPAKGPNSAYQRLVSLPRASIARHALRIGRRKPGARRSRGRLALPQKKQKHAADMRLRSLFLSVDRSVVIRIRTFEIVFDKLRDIRPW